MTARAPHTPGPWTANGLEQFHDADRSISATNPTSGNPVWVARVYGGGLLASPDPESIANARLIAAAPDLLAALRVLLSVQPNPCAESCDHGVCFAVVNAKAAIARAEGRDKP